MHDDFNIWVDMWDKAQSQGIFDDAPKPPQPTPMISDQSFFGPINSKHDDINDCDVEYWNSLHAAVSEPDSIINEIAVPYKSTKETLKQSSDAIARSPNPIQPSSVGTDQDMTPGSLGLTYGEADLKKLAEMKLELHDLTSKMAAFVGDKKTKQLENKINSLKKQIDEFSDELTRALGEKKSIQGVEIAPDRI